MASELDGLLEPERRLCEVLAAYFEAVKAGQAPERRAWLDGHPDLADQLVAFLDEQDRLLRMTEPLRTIAEAAGPDPGDAIAAARIFDDYELLGEIARGGMGVVYRARQRSLNRLVALKMLRPTSLADDGDARRFRLEAEAVAQLDHPNIVPIYEVGEHDDISYFAMKYIEGASLAQRPPGPAADPRAAARLVATIARAAHHAHQRGVLHRDLKPSNILIDAEGQPHVTDFGLAKRVEGDSELTQSGAILGTPSYMAPEQASGQRKAVTTATDVYGLGAVLFALLTGKPPFRGDSVLETLEKVRHAQPEPPSGVGRGIDRDLETICLKCLEKEPERRYGSALALAEDLERWLRGEPILARPVGRISRAWRWCRRNRGVAGLLALVALLAAAGVVGLAASNVLIARERDEARRQRTQARRAVDTMYTRVAEKWLVDQPGLRPLQREFLQEALAFYREFASQLGEEPEARIEQAAALRRVGDIEDALSSHEQTERIYLQALAALEGLTVRPHLESRRREELAAVHIKLGRLLGIDGRITDAVRHYRAALGLYQDLLARHPDRIDYRMRLANCFTGLSAAAIAGRRLSEAEDFCRQALETFGSSASDAGAPAELSLAVSWVYHNLGNIQTAAGRSAEAESSRRQAIECSARALRESPTSPRRRHDHASHLEALAESLKARGKWLEAEGAFHAALRIQEPLAAELPETSEFREDLALSLCELGRVLRHLGRSAAAEDPLRRSLAIAKELISATPRLVFRRELIATALLELAGLERDRGHLDTSRELLAEARSHLRIGLAINPQDPGLNQVNAELESATKGGDSARR